MMSIERRLQKYLEIIQPYLEPSYPAERGETVEQWIENSIVGDGGELPWDSEAVIWCNLDDTDLSLQDHGKFGKEVLGNYSNMKRERIRVSPFIGGFSLNSIPGEKAETFDGGCVVQQVMSGSTVDGTPFKLPVCIIYYIKNNKIVRLNEYYDRSIVQKWGAGYVVANLKRLSVGDI